ncbi:MAG: glycosyl hydrolase family 3 [Lachnospiraceae bacterium]|nr:glycosyl hydrolase family 3 [Lachnospiraceae bacterium]
MNLREKPFYLTDEQVREVEETLSSLTVKQKVGQLFCVMGQDFGADELKTLVKDYNIGGILYRPAPAKEIRAWYEPLDEVARIPLLKAANLEEGGTGGISDGAFFGWPMTVAATDDLGVMEKFAKVCALEGQSVGLNWTFSPVCDLDLNYRNPITNVRTCGSDLERVKSFCSQYVRTLQEQGMAACAKHYPGDGVDFRDQHLHPTYNSLSAKDWYESYGAIYRQLIEDGLMSVMVGHIVQPNVEMDINPELRFEDCLPGSLSKELLAGVLREKFGFNGVITTDATIMSGFTQAMPRREAIPAAIMAGCDMLVFTTGFYEDYQYMLDALESGLLTEKRLDEAVTRTLALKAKVAMPSPVHSDAEGVRSSEDAVCRTDDMAGGTRTGGQLPEAKQWQAECADKCVTLVKNNQDVLPLTPEKFPLIRLVTLGKDEITEGCEAAPGDARYPIESSMTAIAEELLQEAGFRTERFDIEKEELHGTKDLPKDRLTLYLANCEHASNQTAVRLFWAKKHALDVPRHVEEEPYIFVSFSNPYHLQDVPRVKTYINAYSCHRPMIEAVIGKLLGKSAFKGISPIDAFCGLPDARL